jgi:hypothetical protein
MSRISHEPVARIRRRPGPRPSRAGVRGSDATEARVLNLESRRWLVRICPEALRHLFLALGGAVAGDGEDSQRAVGGGGAP